MSWVDRLAQRRAAYTSPSGVRIEFAYEDVSRQITRRTVAHEFPGADGTFVQQMGNGGRRYPIRVILHGDDYDLAADAFEEILAEPGIGRLEHPLYGVVDVVPTGEITRRDNLVSSANQATIDVVFMETSGLVYPATGEDAASNVASAVEAYTGALAASFAANVNLASVAEESAFKGAYRRILGTVQSELRAISEYTESAREQFDEVYADVSLGLDTLVADPLTLAFQTAILIQAPARAGALIGARLQAYRNLLDYIFGGGVGVDDVVGFQTADLYASTYVTGSVIAAVNTEFSTKPEALAAADTIFAQLEDLTAWRDAVAPAAGVVDTGETYQQLQRAVAVAAGYLVDISFSLKQERRITLGRPRSVVELAAELYGGVDEHLDFLIASNDLTGSEIIEIPRGRSIVYYV